jgi:hypothetical protein
MNFILVTEVFLTSSETALLNIPVIVIQNSKMEFQVTRVNFLRIINFVFFFFTERKIICALGTGLEWTASIITNDFYLFKRK